MTTFFFSFQLRPQKGNESFRHVAGAFANAWVVGDDLISADKRVRHYIDEHLWEIIEVEEAGCQTSLSDWMDTPYRESHYRRAQIEGIAVGFTAWGETRPER